MTPTKVLLGADQLPLLCLTSGRIVSAAQETELGTSHGLRSLCCRPKAHEEAESEQESAVRNDEGGGDVLEPHLDVELQRLQLTQTMC